MSFNGGTGRRSCSRRWFRYRARGAPLKKTLRTKSWCGHFGIGPRPSGRWRDFFFYGVAQLPINHTWRPAKACSLHQGFLGRPIFTASRPFGGGTAGHGKENAGQRVLRCTTTPKARWAINCPGGAHESETNTQHMVWVGRSKIGRALL